MTVEHGSSLDSTETAIDGVEIPHADEDGRPHAGQGSARLHRLAAIRRRARRRLARWRSIVATTLVVAAVGVAAGVYFILYRPDQRVDDAAAHRAIQAASDGAVAVLSYSYDHLNRDFDNAKSHLTGDFLTYYKQIHRQCRRADRAAGAIDGVRQGDSGRHFGFASRFGRRAGFRRPDHGKHEKERSREDPERRPGHADKGQRFLADREIRPGRMSAANLVLTVTWSAEAV